MLDIIDAVEDNMHRAWNLAMTSYRFTQAPTLHIYNATHGAVGR